MSAAHRLRSTLRAARLRVVLATAFVALPPLVALVAVAGRIGGMGAAVLLGAAGLAVAVGCIAWRARRIDARWLARRLDAARADMEDSASLLFAHRTEMSTLQRLQRERLRVRLAQAPMPDLRPAWPRRGIAIAMGASLLAIAAALLWPSAVDRDGMRAAPVADAGPGVPRLVAWKLTVEPPAYTGLEAWNAESLDAQVPEGSRLTWTLRFEPGPEAVELRFHDGEAIAVERDDGEGWSASRCTGSSRPARPSDRRRRCTGWTPWPTRRRPCACWRRNRA